MDILNYEYAKVFDTLWHLICIIPFKDFIKLNYIFQRKIQRRIKLLQENLSKTFISLYIGTIKTCLLQ